jgi:argininosuccinate lyase
LQNRCALQATLKKLSSKHGKAVMPGFTHLQAAQPVTLGLHLGRLLSNAQPGQDTVSGLRQAFERNAARLRRAGGYAVQDRPAFTAKKLGFARPMPNTMDAVSARDFANEFLFAAAQAGLHLSRLAEEIILWATPQFGFMTLSDKWSTGSSIMPQKKNPDAAELVRAKTGRLNGNLLALMTIMKGLPPRLQQGHAGRQAAGVRFLRFSRALHRGDERHALDRDVQHQGDAGSSAEKGYITATRLADWLVMELGLPFRDAHHVTGKIVKMAETKKVRLDELSLKDLQSVEKKVTAAVFAVLKL